MSYNDFLAGYQAWKEEEDRKTRRQSDKRAELPTAGNSAAKGETKKTGLPIAGNKNPYATYNRPSVSSPGLGTMLAPAAVPQKTVDTLTPKTQQAQNDAQYNNWLLDLFGRYGTEAGESLAKGADAASRLVQKDASLGERAEAGFDLVKTGLEAGLKGATGGVTNLLDALTGREDTKEAAAAQLAADTTVDDYLGQKLNDVQRQAAIDLLNRYKAENPDIWKADPTTLTEAQEAELTKYRQLDKQLGWVEQTADRLDKSARAIWNNLAATPDVLLETGKAAALNLADNVRNPDWLEALGDAWAGAGYDDVQAMTDEEVRQDAARRAEVAQQLQKTGADRTMDLDTEGAQRMQRAAELQQQAKQGLSGGAALGYDVGMAVADNLITLPLAAIPGVGGGLVLGVQGAKAAAQEANDLAQRGISADEALLRGAVSGGIEAATEKIGLDNIMDIVGKGGKAALNSLFKDGLQQLAKKGGSSAVGRAVAGVLSNMSAEALEETASYVANYAAAAAFGDPEASFSVEELAYSALIGGLSGGVLGGGANVLNAITGRGKTAGAQADQQQSTSEAAPEALGADTTSPQGGEPAGVDLTQLYPGAAPAEAGVPTTTPQGVNGTGVDLTQLHPEAQQPAAEQRNQGEAGSGFDIQQLYPGAESEIINTDNTAVDDNPETHTADELARIEEYKKAADPSLANFYEAVLNGEYDGVPYTVGMVNDRAAQAIQDLTGMDVRGNAHVLDDNGVHHIENRHGAAGEADSTMAEVEDVSRARYVLDNFDEAFLSKDKAYGYSTKQGKRAPVVVFSKKIDGSHVVVEAACDGKKNRCYIITEYIAKNGVDAKEMAKSWHPLDVHKSAAQDTSETQTPVTSPSPVYHAGAETVNEFDIRKPSPDVEQLSSPASSGILASENTEASASEASPASELSALLTAEETAPALERTAKSQSIQSRQESQFVRELGDLFGIPEGESRARLRQLATQLADQRRTTGRIDPALADSIFEEAYQQGRVIDEQFYNDYKDLKDELRTRAVTLDTESRNAAEYADLRRSAMGRVRLTNEGGVPVDVRYMELSEQYPSLFPADIINPLDQARQMVDVAASIHRSESDLESYYGENAEIFRQDARLRFDEAVNELTEGVDKVRRLEEDTARQTASKNPPMPEPMSVEKISRIEKEEARLTRKADRLMARTALTEGDKALLQSLLDGKTRVEDLKPSTPNLQDILKVYEARKAARDVRAPIASYHAQVRQARAARVQKMLEGTEQWKDKSGFLAGMRLASETMERNVRDISRGSGEAGARAAEQVTGMFENVHKNEAASTRWKNDWREQIAALKLNQAESEHVQLLGELRGLQAAEEMGLDRSAAEIEAVTQAEKQHREQYWNQMDMAKVERAVPVFREAFDSIFQKMNEAYIKNGYKPMEYRQGYFPHFTQTQPDGLLRVAASKLGISVENDSLPTDIAGLTYQFRPGRRWNPAALTRQGYETTYDAVKGFDRYLEVAADVIFHTEDIQNLRALEDGIRYKYGDEGLRQQMDAIRADETLTDEQRDTRMEELRSLGKSHLSNFVQEVNEYTNLLAGKKSHFDRMIEKDMGRSIYQTMNNMENRVAANMVAINPGSWLTNFIPIMQSVGETSPRSLLQAGYDTIRAMVKDDGFADQSVFLTNRRGSEPLSMTGLQRLSRTLASPMQIIDDFTSNVVTRAKYMDNVRAGMDQVSALENADRYAANLMADRSKGALPTVFGRKNPLTRLLTMYQVEVNNQLRYLGKDLPDELKEEGAKAIAAALLKIAVASYLFNDLYELVVGRRSALDPIDIVNEAVGDTLGLQLPNTFEEAGRLASGTASAQDFQTDQAGAVQALASTGENVLEQVPFVGGLLGGGRIPISSALPDVGTVGSSMAGLISGETNSKKALTSIGKELAKPAAYLLPPFGGGQIKKMIEGASTIIGGGSYSFNADGKKQLQFAVEDPTAGDWLTALTFGKWALPGGREYLEDFNRESTGYTQAYEAGYGTDILDQLYPGSGKGAGEVSYSTMLPDQEGAEQVDSWLEKLYGSTDNKSVLPSNSTTSFTVDGEKVDLSGPEALEYAQDRQTVGYEILSLFKEPESRPLDMQEQYAVYAQDYAAEVAKAEATGIPPKETSWVTKVQQLAGVSGTEVTDGLIDVLTARAIIATTKGRKQPNGKEIQGSRRRNVLEALRTEGYTTDEAIRLYEALA